MAQKSKIACFVIALALFLLLLAGCDAVGDKYVGFAECLTQKGAVMYGAFWCGHCQNQKKMFGQQGFAKVKYVECDPRGENGNQKLCLEKKITGYPTWEFADRSRIGGEVTFSALSAKTGCELPPEVE